MKERNLFRSLLMAGILFGGHRVWAQQDSFSYRAPLDTIRSAGWYRISLTPEIIAKCKADLADARIVDPNGKFVPCVLQSDLPLLTKEGFCEFPILLSQKEIDTYTNAEVRNISPRPVNSLLVYIRNTGVRRSFTLSGSDDRDHWYMIRDHIALEPSGADSTTYDIQRIDFPASNYKYFKILQEGKGLPLKIIKVGIATRVSARPGGFITPDPVLSRKDSGNYSYIKLAYKEPYLTDRLDLVISSPALYKRKARIYDNESQSYGENVVLEPAHHFYLLPPFKTHEIMLEIDNADNPPLVIEKAFTSQFNRYLLSYLQPGVGYQLLLGNSHATAPEYDLKYFADTISQDPPAILPGTLTSVNKTARATIKEPSRDYKGVYLWAAIIAVLLLLIWLCLNMLKSIRESRR
jgi:hypothetical protein